MELEQTVGKSGRSVAVAHEFHVRSGLLAGKFVDCEPAERKRDLHVVLRGSGTAAKAVFPVMPMTFTCRGPRDKPHRSTLVVTAGVGALVAGRVRAPAWRFCSDVDAGDRQAARASASKRLQDMEARKAGTVPAPLLKEANVHA